MKILVFDNYDSFTYNLVHLVEKILHQKVDVYRNDEIQLEAINRYDKIILSPGPGIPEEAGLLLPLIQTYSSTKSILGVCLGLQAIGQAFGAKLLNLESVYHGVSRPVKLMDKQDALYNGLDDPFMAGRYHSWVVSKEELPSCLHITAEDEAGNIMGLRHESLDVQGVQFHPESVLTPNGELLIRNWLKQ